MIKRKAYAPGHHYWLLEFPPERWVRPGIWQICPRKIYSHWDVAEWMMPLLNFLIFRVFNRNPMLTVRFQFIFIGHTVIRIPLQFSFCWWPGEKTIVHERKQ